MRAPSSPLQDRGDELGAAHRRGDDRHLIVIGITPAAVNILALWVACFSLSWCAGLNSRLEQARALLFSTLFGSRFSLPTMRYRPYGIAPIFQRGNFWAVDSYVVVASIRLLAKKMRVVWVSPLHADAGDGGAKTPPLHQLLLLPP